MQPNIGVMDMNRHKIAILPAFLIGLGIAGLAAGPAAALAVPVAQPAGANAAEASNLLVEVADRRARVLRYNRHAPNHRLQGRRCLTRYGDCRRHLYSNRHFRYHRHFSNRHHFRPWYGFRGQFRSGPVWGFYAPFAGGRIVVHGGGSWRRHVRWCLNHYRSYDPGTNTWIAYSGQVRQCISPYDR